MDADVSGRRTTLSLDGLWDFEFEGPTARLDGEGHTIRTPGIWQAQFPALRNAQGTGRYRRGVQIPSEWTGRSIVLILEGVFHESVILVDEVAVAVHGDGWTAIEVDLTQALDGKTSFVLGVDARVPDDRNGGRFSQSLVGKQDWYGVHGGIWKRARLEARDPVHFAKVFIQTSFDLKTGDVSIRGELSRAAAATTLQATLSRAGEEVARLIYHFRSEQFDAAFVIPDAEPWSPEAPNLYDLVVELIVGDKTVDAIERVVGFRRLEARDGRLVLNGEPFTMFGALDQDWRPDEEGRAPSAEFLEQRFANAKAMGLNTLRCHVKIPDPLYFDLADRIGLIVWLDMPYMQFLAPTTREALRRVFRISVSTHAHHPSIAIWTLFNEGWGIDLDDNPDDRRWLIETFDWAKPLVPASLLVDNSPCFPRNYHLKTDIEDFHWYNGFPHQNDAFAATTRAFAGRASWTFSPHGDAQRRGDEPLICSEFGVWGLPHPREILEADGSEPWWFESGYDWNLGAAYPHGIETRFRDAQLAPIFGDLDGFVSAAQALQYRALKRQIETLRWEPAISGYVITELNDVQWESNGLMDVLNRPRAFAGKLAELQRPWLIIARTARTAVRAGERFEVCVRLAGAAEPPEGARLVWRFGDEGGEAALGRDPTTIALTAGAAEPIAIVPLELEARDAKGRAVLSRSALELCVVPPLGGSTPSLFPIDEAASSLLVGDRLAEPRRERGASRRPHRDATDDPGPRSASRRPQGSARRQCFGRPDRPGAKAAAQRPAQLSLDAAARARRDAVGRAVDGRVLLAAHGGPLVGPARRPHARRTLERASAGSCADRFSLHCFRRIGRFRHGGRMAASRRRLREAQLSRQGLAHRVDLRPHLPASARQSARAACSEGAGAELNARRPVRRIHAKRIPRTR